MKFRAVSNPLLTSPDEPLCWFTSTPRSAGGSLLSWPITFHSFLPRRRLCHTDSPTPRCPSILIALLTILGTAYIEIRPVARVCLFWTCFRQYTLTKIVTKVSDQQKKAAREWQMDEKIRVSGRSRLLRHPCQRHIALNPLCPRYHSLTFNNPGGKHWNLSPKGIQAYVAWAALITRSPDSRLGQAGESKDSPKILMNLCL